MVMLKRCKQWSLACVLSFTGACTVNVGGEGASENERAESRAETEDRDATEVKRASSDTARQASSTDGAPIGVSSSTESMKAGDSEMQVQDEMVVADATASTPMYLQAQCGTIVASDLPVSSSVSAPTKFSTKQLIGGRIDPTSVGNKEHYWVVALKKGFYHFVLDTATSDGRETNIGLDLTIVDDVGEAQSNVFRGNEVARRYRHAAFMEIEADTTVQIRIRPVHGMEEYLFGIFENGSKVPSPRFADCPAITPLTVGEAASFTLGAEDTETEEQWFAMDLALGDYEFQVDSVQADGKDTNLVYRMHMLDRFASLDRSTRLAFLNEVDVSLTTTVALQRGDSGPVYVRFTGGPHALEMTVDVSKN